MSNNSYRSDSFGNQSLLEANMSMIAPDRPSFSSLFTGNASGSSSQPLLDNFHQSSSSFGAHSTVSSPPSSTCNLSSDDEGVYLQISNLDQWYDEANLRNYLMNQLKPITPILSLTIETPSIAKVKVPSTQVTPHTIESAYPHLTRYLCLFSVRQAGRIAPPSQENGSQANFRVIPQGQDLGRMLGASKQSDWTVARCAISRAANVQVS